MPYINKEKILNESPKKRLIIGFNNLKQNFNESNALEYANLYKDSSLSFILENSRMIFSEPFFGYEFYSDIICGDEEYCAFPQYEIELEKINNYIDENQDKMTPEQLAMYVNLRERLINKMKECKNTTTMSNYVADRNPECSELTQKIPDELYNYKMGIKNGDMEKCCESKEAINSIMKENTDSKSFFIYAPYITKILGDNSIVKDNIDKFYKESDEIESFESVIMDTLVVSKLICDKAYTEAVNAIPDRMTRAIFTGLSKESVKDRIDELITEKKSDDETYYSTPMAAVNNIFTDNFDRILFKEEYDEFRNKNYSVRLNVFENLQDLITYEYQTCDNTNDVLEGYNFFDEGTTIEQAFKIATQKCEETKTILNLYKESEITDDVSDEEIDKMDRDVNGDSSKKPEAPKPKNKANAIQFKAMDAEVQQNKSRATAKQKGQEVKNAMKAVAQLPMNVINDIKAQTHKLDELDDQRRKKYMSEPGFRKKAFRNLKLAIMYGGAAHCKLAFVPIVAICRHFSKIKDRRIRNELSKELETEIKICEEKINDANAAGDNKEKYQLMRIKSKLESEKVRVRLNSKYV